MKKTISMLMTLAVAVVLSMSLTGCDDDDDIAYTLAGTWQGNMYVSSYYDGVTYQANYSELCFSQDPYSYSSGTGYWIDYYNNYGWRTNYIANHTTWTVRNGNIYIHLIEEGTDIVITDYGLDDNYFTGEIVYGDNVVQFRLTHVSSPNWNDFYWYDQGYYYSKPNVAAPMKSKPQRIIAAPKE